MSEKPNPELIDNENPEWTATMFSEAKKASDFDGMNRFATIGGILTSEKSVSLEEIEQTIALQGLERFNNCV